MLSTVLDVTGAGLWIRALRYWTGKVAPSPTHAQTSTFDHVSSRTEPPPPPPNGEGEPTFYPLVSDRGRTRERAGGQRMEQGHREGGFRDRWAAHGLRDRCAAHIFRDGWASYVFRDGWASLWFWDRYAAHVLRGGWASLWFRNWWAGLGFGDRWAALEFKDRWAAFRCRNRWAAIGSRDRWAAPSGGAFGDWCDAFLVCEQAGHLRVQRLVGQVG
jgi:hypothetical protein